MNDSSFCIHILFFSLVGSINFLLFHSKFYPFMVQVFQASILFTRSFLCEFFCGRVVFIIFGGFLHSASVDIIKVLCEHFSTTCRICFMIFNVYSFIRGFIMLQLATHICVYFQILLNKNFMDSLLLTKLNMLDIISPTELVSS